MTYINERLSVASHYCIFIIVIYDDESEDKPQINRVYQIPGLGTKRKVKKIEKLSNILKEKFILFKE